MEGFRFLSEDEFFGKNCRLFKCCPKVATVTDFAVLTGANSVTESSRRRNVGFWWLKDFIASVKRAYYIDYCGGKTSTNYISDVGARVVVDYSVIGPFSKMVEELDLGLFEVECGEYPKNVVDSALADRLDHEILKKLDKSYTIYCRTNIDPPVFKTKKLDVYEYQGKQYIKIQYDNVLRRMLSRGRVSENNKSYWLSIEPLTWIVDAENNIAMTKDIVFSGVPYEMDKRVNNFEDTVIKKYMDTYFANEILPKGALNINSILDTEDDIESSDLKNTYGFDLGKVSEEDIIKGSIESNVSVFLHGKSSDGKSARIKELDPDCEIIYMRNATPDSLNGKSVYDASTGKMIDVPPSWYKKIVDKCNSEPDKIHLVFFDELTNALPSMQGMAFNIILDREVNGKWKLPKNVRIVAAGNDIEDSLAANKMAEPLFNRFAHVYINTGVEEWLEWAMSNEQNYQRPDYEELECEEKIHPAIISYVESRNNKGINVLRTYYDGERPNADPRKWEMASKVLYKTNKPEMLRALIGKDITKDFIKYVSYEVDYSKEEEKSSKRLSL